MIRKEMLWDDACFLGLNMNIFSIYSLIIII